MPKAVRVATIARLIELRSQGKQLSNYRHTIRSYWNINILGQSNQRFDSSYVSHTRFGRLEALIGLS
jgi:hypothetical protein